jgi:hypothetical protein
VGTYKVQGIEEARKSKLDAIAQKRATKEIEKAAKKATAQAKAVSLKDESGAAASEEGEESVEKPNGSGKKKKRSMNPMKNIFKCVVIEISTSICRPFCSYFFILLALLRSFLYFSYLPSFISILFLFLFSIL